MSAAPHEDQGALRTAYLLGRQCTTPAEAMAVRVGALFGSPGAAFVFGSPGKPHFDQSMAAFERGVKDGAALKRKAGEAKP